MVSETRSNVAAFLLAVLGGCAIGYACARMLPAPWGIRTVIALDLLALGNLARILLQRR